MIVLYNFRTDLADERTDIYKKNNHIEENIDGIETNIREEGKIKITEVKITNENVYLMKREILYQGLLLDI